jgi:hypothetical protein
MVRQICRCLACGSPEGPDQTDMLAEFNLALSELGVDFLLLKGPDVVADFAFRSSFRDNRAWSA